MPAAYVRIAPRIAGLFCILAFGAGFGPAGAKTLDLSTEPPELNTGVPPNVMMTFDDSGSMAATSLPDGLYANRAKKYYYAPTTNKVYFDPTKNYPAPPKPDGTFFPDSTYTSAWRDGFCANWPSSASPSCTSVKVDLSKAFCTGFVVNDNTASPKVANQAGDYDASNCPTSKEGFWYECPTANSETSCVQKTVGNDTALRQKFANWYSYYRTRNLMARTSLAMAFVKVDDKIRIAWQNFNANQLSNTTVIAKFSDTQRSNFFDWLYKLPTANSTPTIESVQRVGKFYSSGYSNGKGTGTNGKYNPYWEPIANMTNGGMELSCRQNYSMVVTDGYWTNAVAAPATTPNTETTVALPKDDTVTPAKATKTYDPSKGYAKVFKPKIDNSLAATAFYYWATDLRPDLPNRVPQYLADTKINVVDSTVRPLPKNLFDDDEVYFNPANDPAIWQHVVQYMVGLGVAGTLPLGDATLLELRKGTKTWPAIGTDLTKSDDSWHAAVNSRGQYFSASDPDTLVSALSNILNSIVQRAGSATAVSVSTPIVSGSASGFSTAYDTAGWSGSVIRREVAADGTLGNPIWDSGCILTGGACPSTGQTGLTATSPASRKIFTANGTSGIEFTWSALSTTQRAVLNKNPETGVGTTAEDPATWTTDNNGSLRVDYIRGDRSKENAAPNFRSRVSVLGSIIYSGAKYVSSPGELADDFPIGSPEQTAYDAGNSYEKFVYANRNRAPTIYVGSNDGMLHAFNAVNGTERWAFIPPVLISNGRLARTTARQANLAPGADDTPVVKDVLIDGTWKTLLVGSLRLGGRGVYALDVSDPGASSQSGAAAKFKWQFTNESTGGGNLGYTYASANIVRLNNGKWGVLVASGYFPKSGLGSDAAPASVDRTSLFVLDAKDGSVIREIQTPAGVTSYGLSTPAAYDADSNRTTDVVAAGDMAGNLWRFDLSNTDPTQWSVTNIFRTYDTTADIGKRPISVMPVALRDPVSRTPIWVFGTGKYLGVEDRTISNIATQAFYGIRDYGASGPSSGQGYPFLASHLTDQTLTENAATGLRALTQTAVPDTKRGWRIPLGTQQGERVVVEARALFSSNLVILATLLPAGDDPCDPSRKGSIMVVDAAGGAGDVDWSGAGGWTPATGSKVVGSILNDVPFGAGGGGMPTITPKGGGIIMVPGFPAISVKNTYWHRGAWRELQDQR